MSAPERNNSALTPPETHQAPAIGIGSTVIINIPKHDQERIISIIDDGEDKTSADQIRASTPMAKALLGKKAGDRVNVESPGGALEVEIIKS